ncbi:MAG TPA: hypothetical protein VK595_14230 [Vicinamibacterales bacterium]|nr:hypothetical protein [Vicinamibacterales bacterium]
MSPSSLSRRRLLQLGAGVAAGGSVTTMRAAQTSALPVQDPPREPFSTRGLFLHVWDLQDEGVDRVLGWIRDAGLNQMVIAGSYHSGWFVHPRKEKRRLYMTQGGALYFPPDPRIFRSTPIEPAVADFVRDTNWLRLAGEKVDHYGLRMISWTVGVHNTRRGLRYPEYTQHTAYGDSLPHALSIGHDASRSYLKAVCRDLATNYPMYGLQLEAFGWMGVRHGHHHERDLTDLGPVEQSLLSICFNPSTMTKARARGIDADKARDTARQVLDAAFREAPDRPANHPRSIAELEDRSPELKQYNQFRQALVNELIVEIKQEALKGTTCRLLLQGGYQAEVAHVADGFASSAYGQPPESVLAVVQRGAAALPAGWKGEFPCFIRLGMGVPASPAQLRSIVSAVKQGGSTGPVFYNYSESPPRMLSWVKDALQGL